MFQKRHHNKFNPSTESNHLRYWSTSTSFFFKKIYFKYKSVKVPDSLFSGFQPELSSLCGKALICLLSQWAVMRPAVEAPGRASSEQALSRTPLPQLLAFQAFRLCEEACQEPQAFQTKRFLTFFLPAGVERTQS